MPPPRGTFNPLEGPADYDMTSIIHSDTYPAIDPTKADFGGRTILITGASRGLGLAMSIAFAKAGASRIAIIARSDMSDTVNEIKASCQDLSVSFPDILPIQADLGEPEDVQTMAAQVEKLFGHVDIIINNAAIVAMASIADSDPSEWLGLFKINLFGPYLMIRALMPLLLQSTCKTLVTVSSVGAHLTTPNLSAYQISKLAVLRLTEFFTAEYADKGILAYSVHPGNIPTDAMGGFDGIPPEMQHIFVDTPELSADSVVYLTSQRRTWLSARYINLTWDLPELMSKEDEIVSKDMLRLRLAV